MARRMGGLCLTDLPDEALVHILGLIPQEER
jgi:hypothetical protein